MPRPTACPARSSLLARLLLLCVALSASGVFALGAPAGSAASDGIDADGDGWTVTDGDCCDGPADGCGMDAPWVNPGAFDAGGNLLDDDCDGTVDNPPASDCSTAVKLTGLTGSDLAQAMDLCQSTVQSPPLSQRRWGVIAANLLRASGFDTDPDLVDRQAAVFMTFGDAGNAPRANLTMAALATKTARDEDDPGFQEPEAPPGWNDVRVPPLRYDFPACPSPSTAAVNSVRLRLLVRVPTNAVGFRFRDTYFSAEFPDWCVQFNDHLLALLYGLAPGIPADHNIQLDSQGNPVTVNSAVYQACTITPPHPSTCPDGPARLADTGFDGAVGAATTWLTVTGPVVGGEDIQLEIHLFNLVDGANNSLVLLDDFRWDLRPSGQIFTDGFESGDTSLWSSAVP